MSQISTTTVPLMVAPIVTCGSGLLAASASLLLPMRPPQAMQTASVAAIFREAEARPLMPRPIEKYGMNLMETVRPSVPKSHSYLEKSRMPGVLAAKA